MKKSIPQSKFHSFCLGPQKPAATCNITQHNIISWLIIDSSLCDDKNLERDPENDMKLVQGGKDRGDMK